MEYTSLGIRQTPSDLSILPQLCHFATLQNGKPDLPWQDGAWMARLFSSFPFSHLLELARVGDPLRRGFYELGCSSGDGGTGTETPENQHGLWWVGLSKDQECRWSHFKNLTPPEEMQENVRDRVVPQPVPNFRFG